MGKHQLRARSLINIGEGKKWKTRAACAVKESETDKNIEQQITYFIVIWSFLTNFGYLRFSDRPQLYHFDVIALM